MTDTRKPPKSGGEVRIGNYIIGETLGVGTFGKVKVGIHKSTGVQVAVKIVNRDKIKQLDVAGKLRREIENLWLFRHPHIIKLYQVISTPTDIFMIMEYVCGGELFDHIVKAGKLCEKDARRFFQQIVSGVDYCHRHKVVHRDLKPENLLLDSNSNVKIADFGLSNIMEDGEFLNTSCGSPNYAAPEVISGKLYAGPEVDVWSCGVILYALLCGTLPFDDEQIPNLFKKIKSGLFRMPEYLSEGVRDLLRSMLTVDPIRRITIDEIKRHPWFIVDLPGYLFPQDRDEDASIIDKEAVMELSRVCNVSENEILTALIGNDPTDQLCVAYHLIIDNKRYGSDVNMEEVNNFYVATGPDNTGVTTTQVSGVVPTQIVGPAASTTPLSPSQGGKLSGSPHCARAPHLSGNAASPTAQHGPGTFRAHPERMPEAPPLSRTLDPLPDSVQASGLASGQVKRFKWHLGIRSQSKPWDIMHEVFKAMRSLGYEWKVVNPFNVRVRKWNPMKQHYSKLVLQLYQVDTRSYLLDFKCIDENPHPESDPMNSRRRSSGVLGTAGTPLQEKSFPGVSTCSSTSGTHQELNLYSAAQRHQTMEFFEMCTELITTLAR